MWAINDMFGTGTRGFAIITTLISSGTYAVVFGLLHPPSRQTIAALLMRFTVPEFLQRWVHEALEAFRKILNLNLKAENAPNGSESGNGDVTRDHGDEQDVEDSDDIAVIARTSTKSSKGKRKEGRTEEEVQNASQQSLATGKTSLITRFRGNKSKEPDHELGEIHDGGATLDG
jgi:hypothetical protein